ncbi:MAG: HAD-IIIA family hydrolase [Flavihumibacter sp.]
MLDLAAINSNWTLFLDRDGVLNIEKIDDYIYHRGEFRLYENTLEALAILQPVFGHSVLVTNQRGVEKGLMTEEALLDIHRHLQEQLAGHGIKPLDGIYYNTSLLNDHPDRKPQTGMALRAQADFPDICFSKSLMVGNNLSDMFFGRNAGMHTVFVKTTKPGIALPHPAIDLAFNDLLNFALALRAARNR